MRSSIFRLPLAILAVGALTVQSQAQARPQSPVDIGLFRNGNELEVRVRPNADFDGIFSNLVFSIRWETSTQASLGAIKQEGAASRYIPLQPSGQVRDQGMYRYQVFAGFGFETIRESGASWKTGKEYVIATIPFTGNADFQLLNDHWTRLPMSNADYYVSLNGYDVTGDIYKGQEGVTDQVPFSIMPNPTRGPLTITMPVKAGEDLWFEIHNAAGQLVYTEKPNAGQDVYRKDLDLGANGAGVYVMRVYRNGEAESHRIVVN